MNHRGHSRRRVLSAVGGIATTVGIAVGVTVGLTAVAPHAAAAPSRFPVPGSQPQWPSSARQTGATPSGDTVDFGVLLGLRDQSGAEAALQDISDPNSADYGAWLSNAEFDASYAPLPSTVSAVRQWLTAQGFALGAQLPSGMYIPASGSAAQVEKTFGTSLSNFSLDGQTVHANTTALTLPSNTPAAVVSAITGVLGVNQAVALKKPASQPADTLPGPPDGVETGRPCSSYFGQKLATTLPTAYGATQPYVVCGYGPQQLQSAYGLSPAIASGINGSGITVAITDAYAAPAILADANQYSQVHGQPTLRRGQFTQLVPSADAYDLTGPADCDAQGWYGEETLDVEAVHAMAPGAKIVYVGATDCMAGLDDAWASAIDNHVADVISNSWTDYADDPTDIPADYADFYAQFSLEAALTGITVTFSSGDNGDHSVTDGAPSVEFPTDVPYVTGVGGTTLEIGASGQRVGEYGWQNAYAPLDADGRKWDLPASWSSGGGGGTSQLFAQPWYQRGVVPKQVAGGGSSAARTVPDVAMDADPNTGMLVGETQAFPDGTYWDQYRIGGTSLAAPLFAGVIAVAGQFAHHPIGFANPLLYAQVGTSRVNDIVAPRTKITQARVDYNNELDASDGVTVRLVQADVQSTTLHDTPGWDNETGVGTPNGLAFLAGVAGTAR